MVLLESAKLVGLGSAVGLFIGLFATRPLAIFLIPGLSPTNVTSFSAVIGLLAAIGLLGTAGPLRRATSVDPARSLKYE